MYPYHALFHEARREADENRFWFWNSMHFPVPMPAFDVVCIDSPYQALGEWQNRVFAVPPAMGIDYRVVNGYVYISGNPVTDPDKIAERAGFFQRRAGYYYQHWDELYGEVQGEDAGADRGDHGAPRARPPEYEPDEVMLEDDRNTAFYEVLAAYGRTLRCGDLMWQHHFEFLLLGYGAYVTFSELLQEPAARTSPTSTSRRWSRASTCSSSSRARSCAGWRSWRSTPASTAPSSRAARRPRSTPSWPGATRGARGSRSSSASRTPGSTWRTGDGLYHFYGSWYDDPSIAYASVVGHVRALNGTARRSSARARSSRASATGSPRSTGRCSTTSRARPSTSCSALSRTVFPYVEEHKFYCDYWFLTRWWNKLREFGALLAEHGFLEDAEDIFQLGRHEVAQALDELLPDWATGGAPLGPSSLAADRRPAQGAARAARRAGRRRPRSARRPRRSPTRCRIMLWGVTTAARAGVGERRRRRRSAHRRRRVARASSRAPRASWSTSRRSRASATATSSSARSPRRPGRRSSPNVRAVVTDIGGVMSHAAIVCREYGLPAVVGTGRATAQIRTGQTIRVDGTSGVVTDPRRRRPRCPAVTPRRFGSCGGRTAPRSAARARTSGELLSIGLNGPVRLRGRPRARSAPSWRRRGSTARSLPRWSARRAATSTTARPPRRRSARRCASLRCPTRSERSSRPATTSSCARAAAEPPVAVRSSAIGEDSEEATFAGQQESFLWVRGLEQICDAVRDCWASLYTPRAITYRARARREVRRRPWASRCRRWSTPRSPACSSPATR